MSLLAVHQTTKLLQNSKVNAAVHICIFCNYAVVGYMTDSENKVFYPVGTGSSFHGIKWPEYELVTHLHFVLK
jgi:hypothetical protein